MQTFVIRDKQTGEFFQTWRGKRVWNSTGAAKNSFNLNTRTRFDDQSEWVLEESFQTTPGVIRNHELTKETLEILIILLKRDGHFTSNPEYYDVISKYENRDLQV